MTTDETLTDIRALYEAMHGRDYPHEVDTRLECGTKGTVAKHGSYGAFATTTAEALGGLRVKLRDAASKAIGEHEAKAETLRKALDIPSPEMRYDDLRAAMRGWWSARREVDHVMQVSRSITEASEASARLDAAEDTLRDAMGGEL